MTVRRRTLVAACLSVLVGFAVRPPASSAQEPEADARQAAIAAFQQKDLDGAERLCLTWLERHPADVAMTQLLGMIRFRRALHLEAARPPSEFRPAFQQAAQALREAERLAAGRTLAGLDQALGYALVVEGRLEEAVARLDRAVEQAPGAPLPYRLRGRARLELGRHEQAIEDLSRALEIDGADLPTRLLHAQTLAAAGRHADAREGLRSHLRRMDSDPSDSRRAEVLHEIARLSQAMGELESARSALENASRLEPDRLEIRAELGLVLYRLGDFEAAARELDVVLAAPQASPELRAQALLRRGLVDQHAHRYPEARRRFEEALSLDPNRAEALSAYAAVMHRLGEPERARQAWQRFGEIVEVDNRARRLSSQLALQPRDRDARVELVALLARLGRTEEARGQLDELKRHHPGDAAIPALERRVGGGL